MLPSPLGLPTEYDGPKGTCSTSTQTYGNTAKDLLVYPLAV